MAEALGLTTIAEGVETSQQINQLEALDCGALQGFYLGRPESFSMIAGRLQASSPVTPGAGR